jgi:hypothetical protein
MDPAALREQAGQLRDRAATVRQRSAALDDDTPSSACWTSVPIWPTDSEAANVAADMAMTPSGSIAL